ncbi:hypothetical protein SAMN05444161_0705 [Rhizobiales bacterium GAS191]|nr:hypothetical protein SAMN05519103_08195 [Rhizobiales bacterium GAS113]SEC20581.1 hypothetical protein SAMN05444161_0705 [Rhizobiales bacterium GAS191]
MSADYCHPTAPHKKLRMPNWYVSSLMMDRALDAVARRVKKLDRKHDIPYVAGYSKDGKTIYIDRHLPSEMEYKGRKINTDRFLLLHEEVEKTLIDQLNLHYLHAHQIATRAEEAAVRAAGINWRDYDRFMQKYVKKMGDEGLSKIPGDLDLKPYRDEHDTELLERMATSVAKGEHPPGVDKAKLHTKIKSHIAHLATHAHSAKAGGVAIARKAAPVKKAAAKKAAAKKAPLKKVAAKRK